MVSLHIRPGRGPSGTRASLSTIIETDCETSDAPTSWEGMTSAQLSGFGESFMWVYTMNCFEVVV